MNVDIGLPDELKCPLHPNIGLAGLNLKNPLHSSIWDAFTTNMSSDYGGGRYMLVKDHNMFPKRKENLMGVNKPPVRGIFHRNWFNKHLHQIPAIVILFYELDWNDSHWTEKQLDCGLQLNFLRSGLCNRGTKLALVLIQKNSLPTGEDTLAMERAASLTNACELQSNSLFVLPVLHADHLVGYVIRLQNVFVEQAVQYYLGETKRIKNHKDTLNRQNYQLLQARHLIKVSFFHELRKDISTALKHYNMTYNQLIETKGVNQYEVKILCGFVNFKICQLSFRTGAPLDAIAQFDRHIKQFKAFTGHPTLQFQHVHWLANQFEFFGNLFNDTVCAGLTALQTKHPGFYYHQAAQFHMERRQLVEAFRAQVEGSEQQIKIPETKYFGQFPWEGPPMYGTIMNTEVSADEYMRYYQTRELELDYSRVIIPLLNKAVGHFKQYRPTRMKRYLMIQMGQEYYLARDYEKAYSISMCVVHEYRRERWFRLLTHVLELCQKCAYLLGNVKNYIEICCELMGPHMTVGPEVRKAMQCNLDRIVAGTCPEVGLGDPNTSTIWSGVLSRKETYSIDVTPLTCFVRCCASFTTPSFEVDQQISVRVVLRSTAPLPLQLSRVTLLFDHKAYNDTVSWDDSEELLLQPNHDTILSFDVTPLPDHTGSNLKITSVKVHLKDAVTSIILQYNEIRSWGVGGWTYSATRIIPRVSRTSMDLAYHSPLLVGENQELRVTIKNDEDTVITNIKLLIQVRSESGSVELRKSVSGEEEEDDKADVRLEFFFNQLESGRTTDVSFIARSLMAATFDVSYVLAYNIAGPNGLYPCEHRRDVRLSSVLPFSSTTTLMSSRCDKTDKLYTCDRCLVYTELTSTATTCSIEVSDLEYSISDSFIYEEEGEKEQGTTVLHPPNQINTCIALQPKHPSGTEEKLGVLSVRWRRHGAPEQALTCTTIILPQVQVETLPVYLTNEVASFGTLFNPLAVRLCVVNVSGVVQEVDLSFDPGDVFMFAGYKHLRFTVLPHSKEFLQYRLVPLKQGLLPLPLPTIKLLRVPEVTSTLLTSRLTKLIYIKPSVNT